MTDYFKKYLKYKNKYFNLKQQIGGTIDTNLLDTKINKFNKIIQICDKFDNMFRIKVLLPGNRLREIIKQSQVPTFIISEKVLKNHFLIYITYNDIWVSFIDVYFMDNMIQYNYSFTKEDFRRKGLSSLLRLLVIDYGKSNDIINQVVSVPFEEAHSKPLLDKFDFIKGEGNMVYLELDQVEIDSYIVNKLRKYCVLESFTCKEGQSNEDDSK
tara:strand:+ start:939 stop:1577 length:639 start_codon:yes stop_codon:yes gene_type:complete